MQVSALVLAGAVTVMSGTAAGVPPEQMGQMPQNTTAAAEQMTNNGQQAQTGVTAPVTTEIPSSQKNYSVVLGEYTTRFSTVNTNRCTNLKLAADAINGYVVEPSATFSFNTVVGQRTAAKGYQIAPVLSNGKSLDGIGGGVCQISTTLFNAALLSNMTITERWNHSLKSSYVPAGRDATVSWPGADFKFANPYAQPVKVIAEYNSGGSVRIAIMGPEGSSAPWVQLSVKGGPKKYVLTRTYGGAVNYTTNSSYL